MPGTKQRIIDANAVLLRRQGYEAAGLKELVTEAGAPFGSIYHFFPGGKEELGAETVRWSGAEYAKLLPAILAVSPDLVSGIRAFFSGAADHLVETGYADACPIATVALEASSHSEMIRQACADVFENWLTEGTGQLIAGGVPRPKARALMIELLAALEGAFILCRAARTTEALAITGEASAARVAAAVSSGRRRRPSRPGR